MIQGLFDKAVIDMMEIALNWLRNSIKSSRTQIAVKFFKNYFSDFELFLTNGILKFFKYSLKHEVVF